MWLIKNPNQPNACMITQWWSKHSIYPANDYKRCVCESWEPNNPDCLLESEVCDIDDNEDNDDNENNDEEQDENDEDEQDDEEEDNNDEDEEEEEDEEGDDDVDDDEEEEEEEPEVNHWIGHNWQVDYRAVDGVLQGISEQTSRRITASRAISADAISDYQTMPNVARAMEILSVDKFAQLFPLADQLYTYDNFMKAIARYPKFCDETLGSTDENELINSCKIELAGILAHMKQSSVDLIYKANILCSGPENGMDHCDYVFESDQYSGV